MNIKRFRIGISYDISTSALTNYNSGGVEVMLNYCFKIKQKNSGKDIKIHGSFNQNNLNLPFLN